MRHNSNIHLSIFFPGFLSDPQQRRFTALQSNCDISVCAGRSIVRAQQKGGSLIQGHRQRVILRYHADERQACLVHGIINGSVHTVQQLLPHPVHHQMQPPRTELPQLHYRVLSIPQGRGILRGHYHAAVCTADCQPEPQPQPQEESFELHLEPEAQQAEEAPVEEDSLNDLIQRAVTGRDTPVAGADVGLPDEDEAESFETPLTPEPDDNAPAASVEDFSTPLEPVEELPEPDDVGSSESADNFETPLVPEPTQPAPAPVTAIPTLGGSFDQGGFDAAKAAWNAGIPVSDLLTGRVSVQAPAPQPTAQPAAATPKVYSVTDERRPGSPNRLRVSSSMGNSASAPISSPPSVAKAMAKAPAAPAAAAPGAGKVKAVPCRNARQVIPVLTAAAGFHDHSGTSQGLERPAAKSVSSSKPLRTMLATFTSV